MAYSSNPGGAYSSGAAPADNEDYFSDNPETKGEERMTPKEEESDEYGETALLPKSILAGKDFKPGEEVVLKIVKMHGDQVEVAYATDKGEEEETPPEEGAPPESSAGPPKGDSEMQSMMY